MKLRDVVKHAILILGITLVFGALCATCLHESARAAAHRQTWPFVIEKAADVTAPAPGQQVTFVITVSNPPGTPYMDIPVLITETLPQHVEFLNASGIYTHAENTVSWAEVLKFGVDPAVVTFSVQVAPTATAYFPIVNQKYAALIHGQVIHGEPVTLTVTPRHTWVYLPLVIRQYPVMPVLTAFNIIPRRGNAAQQFTYSAGVTLTLAATISGDTLHQACFGATAQSLTDCYPFAETLAYTLPSGSGYQTLYARVKGTQGGVSAPAIATITLLENGDFNDELAHWEVTQTNLPAAAREGRALLGDAALSCHPIPIGEAAVAQTVDLRAVPPDRAITLYFDYEIVTEDKFTHSDYDRFMVLIAGEEKHRDGYQGNETIGCGRWHTLQQTNFALDLTPYRGQSVSLFLGNTTRFDEWYNTYTYVDNVHIVVTP
ncbi:MAG TPA: hypothetical protein PKH77_27275 [Anaerolineae bacterium]|nr:hypothetical protein [Anaerolineae bacterium]